MVCCPSCMKKTDNSKVKRSLIKKEQLLKIQKNKCNICGKHFVSKETLYADHIIPLKLGGRDHYENNLQVLCYECNYMKTKKDLKDIGNFRKEHNKISKVEKGE